jgi:hypothetical protein
VDRACTEHGEKKRILLEKSEEKDHYEDLSVGVRIILR